jgi:tRNA G18 (ribose-2'-O)-methylase SpoU
VRTPIDDPNDPRIAVFLGLRDQAARQKRELPGGDMASFFIAEGDLVIERAVRNGYRLRSVLIAARRSKPLPPEAESAEVFEANDAVLTEITGRPELRDPLACFDRPEESVVDELLAKHRTFAVLENVNNPNNLGVIMRNAAGLGVDAVLLDPTCGDPLYRRAVRSSMGQVFTIPHARIGALPEGLDLLHRHGITTVALTPSGDADLRELERPAKVAILLGAEGPGLTAATMAAASVRARIAMSRDIDSLNVANAAAIAFHHLAEKPSAPDD